MDFIAGAGAINYRLWNGRKGKTDADGNTVFKTAKSQIVGSGKNDTYTKQIGTFEEKLQKGKAVNLRNIGSTTQGEIDAGSIDKSMQGIRTTAYINRPSTAIENVKYDPNTENCKIQFRNGKRKYYDFPNVPPEAVEAMLLNPSRGRGYWQNVQQYSVNA